LGECAYAQTFQANLRGQTQSRIDDGSFGLLAFLHDQANGRAFAAVSGDHTGSFDGKFCDGHDVLANSKNKTSRKKERSFYSAANSLPSSVL
jgi:hypothetical protein